MSLIIHMKIPGAIIAASDCRITGDEPIPAGGGEVQAIQLTNLESDNSKQPNPDLLATPSLPSFQNTVSRYYYTRTDSEQKTFLLLNKESKPFAISYCGNANLNGYPASYQIRSALKKMGNVLTTYDVATCFRQFWEDKAILAPPSLLISGYNKGAASILELKNDGKGIIEHFKEQSLFGLSYHGETKIASALIGSGKYNFSLFRLQDAITYVTH